MQGSPRISAHGTIYYPLNNNNELIFRADSKDGFSFQETGNADLLTENLDMYITWYWPEQGETVKRIHQINPNVKCLLYRSIRTIYDYSDEWQTALDRGWLLTDSSGELIHSTVWPENYMADIGNQEYQDFIVQWLNNYFSVYGFDGIFADESLSAWGSELWWGTTAQPVNPRTGRLYTDEEVVSDLISLINYVKVRIGNKLWISNGIYHGQRFFQGDDNFVRFLTEAKIDGFMSEGLFNDGSSRVHYSEDKWKESVDFIVWVQHNWLSQNGKIFCPYSICQNDDWGFGLPDDCTPNQMATFVFSSLLLGIDTPSNYLFLHGVTLLSEIQSLFNLDVGSPKVDYYLIEGTHVYARDFTRIKVLVNPTEQPFSVYLEGTYETLDGQTVSYVTMAPHSGVVLKTMPS